MGEAGMGIEEATVAKRARSGGRDAKQRSRSGPHAPAYITRIIPPYEMMSEAGLVALENEADRILEEVGFEIRGDDEALALFKTAGADIKGQRIIFPRGLVRSIIQYEIPQVVGGAILRSNEERHQSMQAEQQTRHHAPCLWSEA